MILDWRDELPTATAVDGAGVSLPWKTFWINTVTGQIKIRSTPAVVIRPFTDQADLLSLDMIVPTPISIKWDLKGWHEFWDWRRYYMKKRSKVDG